MKITRLLIMINGIILKVRISIIRGSGGMGFVWAEDKGLITTVPTTKATGPTIKPLATVVTSKPTVMFT